MTSVHAKKPARPPAVCSLRNRSEGEINISQGFEVNRSVSATLPSSSSHFFSLRGSRRREKWHGGGDDRSPKRALKEQFLWDLLSVCSGLLSLCLFVVARAPLCPAPALTVESVSPPNDVCSVQLIALCPHLQRERERDTDTHWEREGERGREVQKWSSL